MNHSINPLEHPVCFDFPLWLQQTAWAEHIPFAMFVVSVMRPSIFVELGAFRGVSYCAFCQAVKSIQAKTSCFAVDTWQGDPHAGKLEENVLSVLRSHHDPLYSSFSRLVQSTFDEALEHFDDNSIDLLHIDGFHTYEAVNHDFVTWLPKISDCGIVLLHDTNVRERNFGVWKLWLELKQKYPSFEFLHGHGLGVLAVGDKAAENFDFLFQGDETHQNLIRNFFYQLGSRIHVVQQFNKQNKKIADLEIYQKIVEQSKLMRIYRALKQNNLPEFIRKGVGKIESDK